jgi:hypothetical protein
MLADLAIINGIAFSTVSSQEKQAFSAEQI